MSPGSRDALDALSLRFGQVAATVTLVGKDLDDYPVNDVLGGIAATLDELRAVLDAVVAKEEAA